MCLTSSAVILVPFPIVLLPEVLLAVSAVPGVPGALSAGSFSAMPGVLHLEKYQVRVRNTFARSLCA